MASQPDDRRCAEVSAREDRPREDGLIPIEPDSLPANLDLLPETHRILDRRFMQFRPFGKDLDGKTIHDMSGVSIRSNVEFLEESIARMHGPEAGKQAVEELVRLLNERIPEPSYHVTAATLKNPWVSYSNEFTAYLVDFCVDLSGDPDFQFNMGREKLIPPLMQTLMRPFSVGQIYKMAAYWGQHYCKDSYYLVGSEVTEHSAILRMTLADRALRQFGPYRRACAKIWCNALKVGISIVPDKVHHLGAAIVTDRRCIANGDEYCEWDVRWATGGRWFPGKRAFNFLAKRVLQDEIKERDRLIQEQMGSLESRHKELEEAHVELQHKAGELQRRFAHLTTLHEAGLTFTRTRDREALIQEASEILISKLHYDRVLITFYDSQRQVTHSSRLFGVAADLEAVARQIEVPITDPTSIEGSVILGGQAILVGDTSEILQRLHPLNRELLILTGSESFVSVPLKIKENIIGTLTVDRLQKRALTEDDRELMITFGNQVAIALDNAAAYQEIEELNVGLEAKVRERTIELERLNGELKTVNDQLQLLDRVKSEFFANISHELRTPLSLSLGAFKVLSKLSPNPEAMAVIQSGLRNNARLLFLINELLDLAKYDSGLIQLKKRCIDFCTLVRTVAANFESGERRRIHFRGMDTPVPLEADPNQMKKVLYNLLANAFKFSDPDKGQVWMRLSSKDDVVELEVEDNGIGIPHNQLERIFDRFTQVEGSATRRYEGTGIGLALVKEIITTHKGKIAVESQLGRGSTFIITLPIGAASPDTIAEIEEDESLLLPEMQERPREATDLAASSTAFKKGLPRLLVVDDNADMRTYLARLLNSLYQVVLAKDGVEGLEYAKTFHPDLIITDAMMPRMSGYELVKAIRAESGLRSIPVIMLTARAGSEARVESWEVGADDYIAKPFDEDEILARVNNLIRARAQERELAQLQKEKIARFLPPNLADMIMSGEHEAYLKGHRRELTVVFVDLRGFTRFVERTDPEKVMSILREYHAAMGTLVSEYGGTLERFIGDAVMVYFNDPLPCPNHAEKAVKMAIDMRQAIDSLQHNWRRQGIELGAGIGIATGYATIGAVGFEDRLDYAAIGPVTNLAARLCSDAQHGQILVSDRVLPLVKDLIAEPIGELALKGIQDPVPVSQVIGMRP